eukprot:s50_g26.t1
MNSSFFAFPNIFPEQGTHVLLTSVFRVFVRPPLQHNQQHCFAFSVLNHDGQHEKSEGGKEIKLSITLQSGYSSLVEQLTIWR